MSERTELEQKIETLIVEGTRQMLDAIFEAGMSVEATAEDVSAAIHRFSGPDLEDVWESDYLDDWSEEGGRWAGGDA